jgi:hypothetical protein
VSALLKVMVEDLAPHPFSRGQWVLVDPDNEAGAVVEMAHLSPEQWGENHIHISDIRALRPGGGRDLMTYIVDKADELGAMISLIAKPLPAIPGAAIKMTKAKLRKWYQGFGFVRQRKSDGKLGDKMVRMP